MTTQLEQEALNEVNVIRAEYGLEPLNKIPEGYRNHCQNCPIAKALSMGNRRMVSVFLTHYDDVNGTHSLPPWVRRFVSTFDNGALPEYDLDLKRRMGWT